MQIQALHTFNTNVTIAELYTICHFKNLSMGPIPFLGSLEKLDLAASDCSCETESKPLVVRLLLLLSGPTVEF